METVTSWLEEQLEQSAEGELARRYLLERGLSHATIARFRLGYAPNDRHALIQAMQRKNIREEQLVEAGMLIRVEDRAPIVASVDD